MLCDSPYSSYNKKKLESVAEMTIPLDKCIRADTLDICLTKDSNTLKKLSKKLERKNLLKKLFLDQLSKKGNPPGIKE